MASPSSRGSVSRSGSPVYSLQLPMMRFPDLAQAPGHQLTLCRAAAAHLSVQRKIPTSTRPSDISTFMFLLSQDLSSVTPGLSVEAEGGTASSSMMPQTATIYDLT